jgi:hypothetical protein
MTNRKNRIITVLTVAVFALAIVGTASGSEITFVHGTDVNTAQIEILGLTDPDITANLNDVLNYSALLSETR